MATLGHNKLAIIGHRYIAKEHVKYTGQNTSAKSSGKIHIKTQTHRQNTSGKIHRQIKWKIIRQNTSAKHIGKIHQSYTKWYIIYESNQLSSRSRGQPVGPSWILQVARGVIARYKMAVTKLRTPHHLKFKRSGIGNLHILGLHSVFHIAIQSTVFFLFQGFSYTIYNKSVIYTPSTLFQIHL